MRHVRFWVHIECDGISERGADFLAAKGARCLSLPALHGRGARFLACASRSSCPLPASMGRGSQRFGRLGWLPRTRSIGRGERRPPFDEDGMQEEQPALPAGRQPAAGVAQQGAAGVGT